MSSEMDLAAVFEAERPRLRGMAARMLGGPDDADDVLQEAWLRASRAGVDGTDEIANPQGWLTTIVARLCLDSLRARRPDAGEAPDLPSPSPGPDDVALAADAVGVALSVVLDSLEPNQRLAFMLHDVFSVPFEEIAEVLGKSVVACRQLASRARATVRAASPGAPRAAGTPGAVGAPGAIQASAAQSTLREREVVDAFLLASREGDLPGLVAVLAPDVVARSDAAAALMGSPAAIAGRAAVADFYNGKAVAIRRAVVDGAAGAAWTHQGELKVIFEFTVVDGLIQSIDLLAVPEVLAATELELLTRN